MVEPRFSQPLDVKVNPRKWTTKVNIALVIGVSAVFLIGVIYLIFGLMNQSEVQQDVHEEVAPASPAR